tara:strand:- start:839 stop:1060 length:222 start_codon:yes stop_codon:yes gene_type:complete
MSLIPVQDNPGLFRDSVSGAIVNRNAADYDNYVKTRNRLRSKDERIGDLEVKVDNLSNDIGDIKSMLQSIVGK